jgi:hypothetical protein
MTDVNDLVRHCYSCREQAVTTRDVADTLAGLPQGYGRCRTATRAATDIQRPRESSHRPLISDNIATAMATASHGEEVSTVSTIS